MPLIREIYRYYEYEPRRKRYYPELRPHRPLSRTFNTPLKMLVLVGIGAALSPLVPALTFLVLQGAMVMAVGLVVWLVWRVIR